MILRLFLVIFKKIPGTLWSIFQNPIVRTVPLPLPHLFFIEFYSHKISRLSRRVVVHKAVLLLAFWLDNALPHCLPPQSDLESRVSRTSCTSQAYLIYQSISCQYRVHLVEPECLNSRLLFSIFPFEVKICRRIYGVYFCLKFSATFNHWFKVLFPRTNDPCFRSLCCEGPVGISNNQLLI